MFRLRPFRQISRRFVFTFLLLNVLQLHAAAASEDLAAAAGQEGLLVIVGCDGDELAVAVEQADHFLVNILATDEGRICQVREAFAPVAAMAR